ncbi:VOC family protein [Aeromicrobium phragmitis]|uniref:VOC family protein n=1 Tax=Aeromicrobium phragmitis TaxID=2478914 RepID=A0A3L8PJX7_9ACTN|nr:VOC family protein [Aeromicrobium phragmitis]RLV55706.1 VOC family protein [Aeromicrobium phragmitis]
MTEKTTAVTGAHTTHGVPHGSTSLTPHIVVSPATKALHFYREVFAAMINDVTHLGDDVAHAELDFGHGRLTLSDPLEEYGLVPGDPERGASYSLALYVPDVDDVVARALQCGATLRESVESFVSGDRFGSVLDPFGVRWSIMTRVEDLSPEESRRRVADWAATQAMI